MENPCKIVCFGDSITKGYYKKFNDIIKQEYSDIKMDIINQGVVGETSVGGIKRLDYIIELEPDVVVLGFGMNDWRKGVNKEVFKQNIELIVNKLKNVNVRVILLTMNPDFNTNKKVSNQLIEYNEIIKEIAFINKIRIADVYSSWVKELPNIKDGLYDDIHPNKIGYELICKALIQIVPRSQTVIVFAFNGLHAFCNFKCEYCYVPSEVNSDQGFEGNINDWHRAIKKSFGNENLVFYLAFGEPMAAAKNFYDVLDMMACEPNWSGHMTSNLSFPLKRLVNTRLVKEGRFNINASFHPTQISIDKFLDKLLFLREHGIEAPVIYVMYPPLIKDFDEYFKIFNDNDFIVHVRRFKGWYNGKSYPKAYSDDERQFIAKYCDDATIKYMLNQFNTNLKGKLSYAGMYYLLMDENGNVFSSPDSKDKFLGNIFENDVRLFTEPQPYALSWNGSVNGIAPILEINYRDLEDNFVISFAGQGGVYRTNDKIVYKNLFTDFTDPKIAKEYNFVSHDNFLNAINEKILFEFDKSKSYAFRKVYRLNRMNKILQTCWLKKFKR